MEKAARMELRVSVALLGIFLVSFCRSEEAIEKNQAFCGKLECKETNFCYAIKEGDNITSTCGDDNQECGSLEPGRELMIGTETSKKWCCKPVSKPSRSQSEVTCEAKVRVCGADKGCNEAFCVRDPKSKETRCPNEDEKGFSEKCRDLERGGFLMETGKWCCPASNCPEQIITCGEDRSCDSTFCLATTNDQGTVVTTCPPKDLDGSEYCIGLSATEEKNIGEATWCCRCETEDICTCPGKIIKCGDIQCGLETRYCNATKVGVSVITTCPANGQDPPTNCSNLITGGEIEYKSGVAKSWCCKKFESCDGYQRRCGPHEERCQASYCIQDAIGDTRCPKEGERHHKLCQRQNLADGETLRLDETKWCCQDRDCNKMIRICGNERKCQSSICTASRLISPYRPTDYRPFSTDCPLNPIMDSICLALANQTEQFGRIQNGAAGNSSAKSSTEGGKTFRFGRERWCCSMNECDESVRRCGDDHSCKRSYCIHEKYDNGTEKTRCPKDSHYDSQCEGDDKFIEGQEKWLGNQTWCCKEFTCHGRARKCGTNELCQSSYCLAKKANGVLHTECPKNGYFDPSCGIDLAEGEEIYLGENSWCCKPSWGSGCPGNVKCGSVHNCTKPYCFAEKSGDKVTTFCATGNETDRECDESLRPGEERWLAPNRWCCKSASCEGRAIRCGTESDGSEKCKTHYCIRGWHSNDTTCPYDAEKFKECEILPTTPFGEFGHQIPVTVDGKKFFCCSSTNRCLGIPDKVYVSPATISRGSLGLIIASFASLFQL